LRVLQCVDPSAGFRFSVQSRIRASKAGVSLLAPRPAWRLNSPASRSRPNRLLQRAINASLQSSLSRICTQLRPASSSKISRARRPSSARPLRLVARWLNSIRSDSVSIIVLFMSTIILPFYALQTTSCPALLLGSGGVWAGPPNSTPSDRLGNTSGGSGALSNNTTGGYNTAFGDRALLNNTGGNYNTVSGALALSRNTTGSGNTASGYRTLLNNDTGSGNTVNGFQALLTNSSGGYNTTSGAFALYSNTTGSYNAAFGTAALESNITGTFNTAIGYAADSLAGDITNGTAISACAE